MGTAGSKRVGSVAFMQPLYVHGAAWAALALQQQSQCAAEQPFSSTQHQPLSSQQ